MLAEGWLEGVSDRQELAQRNAYDLAYMIRSAVWAKRMPVYEDLFEHGNVSAGELSDEAMFTVVRTLNAALGGTEE